MFGTTKTGYHYFVAKYKILCYGRASLSTRLGRHARELQRKLKKERARELLNRRVGNRKVSNSDILRAALVEDNGVPDSRIVRNDSGINYAIGNQAHHIVETRKMEATVEIIRLVSKRLLGKRQADGHRILTGMEKGL